MTTKNVTIDVVIIPVVEAYRLGRYDNIQLLGVAEHIAVVEAYHLGRYDNSADSGAQHF